MFITYGFIYRIKKFFCQIDLNVEDNITIDIIYEHLIQTVCKIQSVIDVNKLICDFLYCNKKIKKIKRLLYKKNKRIYFDGITFKKSDLFKRNKQGNNIVVTNALDNRSKEFQIIFQSSDDTSETLVLTTKLGWSKIKIFSDYKYYGVLSGDHFKIYTSDKTKILDIVRDKDELTFHNIIKKSRYQLINDEYFIDLIDNEESDEEFATISSDILKPKVTDKSTQVLWLFDDDKFEISVLVCIAITLLTKRYYIRLKHMQYMFASQHIN